MTPPDDTHEPTKAAEESAPDSPSDDPPGARNEVAEKNMAEDDTAQGDADAADDSITQSGSESTVDADEIADPQDDGPSEKAPPLPPGVLSRHPWLTFLLPFIVYAVVGALEPSPPEPKDKLLAGGSALAVAASSIVASTASGATPACLFALSEHLEHEAKHQETKEREEVGEPVVDNHDDDGRNWLGFKVLYRDYPKIYTLKIALVVLSMLLVLPGYRTFPFRINSIAIAVGVLGAIAWILLCKLHLERGLFTALGFQQVIDLTRRPGFNPFLYLSEDPAWLYGFLAVRLFGLVIVVSIMEEFFLRGFVLRVVMDIDYWEEVPFGKVNDFAIIAGTLVPILMHPMTELLAVAVWFSAVTWLMLRTRNIWDCVAAHTVTNLILGIYVVISGDWWLM